jgi:glycosyltransferase involved in cell wall biosynthesis
MNIALRGLYPECFMRGGAEMQLEETEIALNLIGENAFRIDLQRKTGDFDILHLFQDSSSHWPIVEYSPPSLPLVVSSICPGKYRFGAYGLSWRVAEKIARALRTRTTYGLYADVLKRANAVLVITHAQEQFYRWNYPFTKEKLHVIPNGVRDVFFNDKEENPAQRREGVAFIGSIIRRKNPVLLARALRLMKVKGVFAGPLHPTEVDYSNEFLLEIRKSDGLLRYIGPVKYASAEHLSILRTSTVYCLPSSSEVQSLAALEAKASGCVIALGDYDYAKQPPLEGSVRLKLTSVATICEGISKALSSKPTPLQKSEFSWRAIAERIRCVYKSIA